MFGGKVGFDGFDLDVFQHLINSIQNAISFVSWNASGLHFVVLDEVDFLTDAAKASFKALMNRTNVVFIMTTNHLNEVDLGVQNRSVLHC